MPQTELIDIDLHKAEPVVMVPRTDISTLQHEQALQLVYNLHASLDVRDVIQNFAYGIRQHLLCDGIYYQNNTLNLAINIGQMQKHTFNYQLTISKENLGEITFSRNSRFGEAEILMIEELLCLLLHPLRNAIAHKAAVDSALLDPLTGLPNRSGLEGTLRRDMEFSRRYDSPFSILALDIDYFKNINDSYGHTAGDQYLKQFAKQLRLTLRDSDLVFRTGGEEFIALLGRTDTAGAVKLADRICKIIVDLVVSFKASVLQTTVSIGLATYTSGDTSQGLIERADAALYRAKAEGRNRVCI